MEFPRQMASLSTRELAYIGTLDEIYREDDKDQANHDRAFEQFPPDEILPM